MWFTFGVLFAVRTSTCSPLRTLPGAASPVLASSPCEACRFRFFFPKNQSGLKYLLFERSEFLIANDRVVWVLREIRGQFSTEATTRHRNTAGAACTGLHTHHGATGAKTTAAWDRRGGGAKGAGG